MHGKAVLIGGGLAVIAALGTLYVQLYDHAPTTAQSRSTDNPAPAQETDSETTRLPTQAELQQLLQNPTVQTQEQRMAFHQAYRSFISGAGELPTQQREQQADALRQEIERYEQRSELAMSEALLLQLGLIQLTTQDEQAQKAQAAALVERYKARSAEREARAAAPSAEFQRYKSDEKRIVDEVLAMDNFPDGLSRDEYLRQRLQQAREQHYQ